MFGPLTVGKKSESGGVLAPIIRPRVIERIAAAARQRLTLIVAPAGFGKSVALRQYLASVDHRFVLYNVEPHDATLLGFARGLADALFSVAPGARQSLSGAFEKSCTSATPGIDLAAWMHAHIESYTDTIVIDNLHLSERDSELSRFLVSLIERTGPKTRWMLASRSALVLPVASWLAYGETSLPVDEVDLRFEISEAREASEAAKLPVHDEELREILALTEGWSTALSFALHSATRSGELRSIEATTREMTYRYLAEQVYHSLEQIMLQFLLLTRLMQSVEIDVLAAGGYDDAKFIIEELRRSVAFIYAESPVVYRYHELFREFLRHQLSLLGSAAVLDMCARAALMYEKYGNTAQALVLYAEGKAVEPILRLLEQSGFDLIEQGHADVVESAARLLSTEQHSSNPAVLGLQASFEANAGRLERAERLYRRGIALAAQTSVKIRLAARLATMLTNQSQGDGIALLLPFSGRKDISQVDRCEIHSLLAAAYAVTSQVQDALDQIRIALETVEELENDVSRAYVYQRAGFVAFYSHNPEDAKKYSMEAARLALQSGLYGVAASAYSVLYSTCFDHDDDVERMSSYAQQLAGCAAKAGDMLRWQIGLQQMLEIETRRGNLDQVVPIEEKLASAGVTDPLRFSLVVVPARALRASWKGDFSEAYQLLSRALEGHPHGIERTLRYAEYALFLAVDGERELALAALKRSGSSFTTTSSFSERRQSQIAILLSALANALLKRSSAVGKLLHALAPIDQPSIKALHRATLTLLKQMRLGFFDQQFGNLVTELRAIGYGGYARTFEAIARRLESQTEEPGILTVSEVDVLQALASGQAPKDIALETARSVNTIHAHVRAAISKLRCHGRQQAIAKARHSGLII
ncbi:MAG: LuxR C-terminal-related transcriptional regulator [Candidatus Eremiobacteraeota bacterium]|nr:LuxR C-terminal-related transcriptional regulator [Candidatus Eremiobacteraeota bacterium]